MSSVRVTFGHAHLADICNSRVEIDRRWGTAAADVRTTLSVLAAVADIASFHDLPNVRREEDQTVFEGLIADVMLTITPGEPRRAHIVAVDARIRAHQP